jgi:hypothetical protein
VLKRTIEALKVLRIICFVTVRDAGKNLSSDLYQGAFPRKAFESAEITNKTRKTTKRILATPTAAPARPVKPRSPAIKARIRNVMVQWSMIVVG